MEYAKILLAGVPSTFNVLYGLRADIDKPRNKRR